MTLETMPLSKALNAGLRKAMQDDPRVLMMGEDIGQLGGGGGGYRRQLAFWRDQQAAGMGDAIDKNGRLIDGGDVV